MKYCEHNDCRVDTLADLAHMLKTMPWRDDIKEAMAAIPESKVRCRHVPRKGPVDVPLPGAEVNVPEGYTQKECY
jgi:hypothetical protein